MYMYLIVYINVMYAFMYICMVCMMYVRMYVCIYLYLSIYIYQCNLLYYIYILSVGKIWNLPKQVSQSVSQKILITYQV